jgi:DnaJ homolog subfamily C member 1
VLVFLAILTTCLHYLIQRLNYKRDKVRVEKIMQAARVAAWGPKLIAIEGRRKVRAIDRRQRQLKR